MKNFTNSNNSNSSSKKIEQSISSINTNKINQPTLTILGDGRTKRKRSKDSYIEIALEKENYKNSNSNTLNQSRTSKSHSIQRNKTLNTESIDSDRIQFRNDYLNLNQKLRDDENLNFKIFKNYSEISKLKNQKKKNGIPISNTYTLNNSNYNMNQFDNLSLSHRRNQRNNFKSDFLNYTMREMTCEFNKKKNYTSISLNNSQIESKNNSKRLNSNYDEKNKLYKGLDLNLVSNSSNKNNKKNYNINQDNNDFSFYKNNNDSSYMNFKNYKNEFENYSNRDLYDTQIASSNSNNVYSNYIYPSTQRYIFSSNDNRIDNEYNYNINGNNINNDKYNYKKLYNITNSLSLEDLSTGNNNIEKYNNLENTNNNIYDNNLKKKYYLDNKENNPNLININNELILKSFLFIFFIPSILFSSANCLIFLEFFNFLFN